MSQRRTSSQEHGAVVLHAIGDHELLRHDHVLLAKLTDEAIGGVDQRGLRVNCALELRPVVVELRRGPQVEGMLVVELDHVQVEQIQIGVIARVLFDVLVDGAVLLTHHQDTADLTVASNQHRDC